MTEALVLENDFGAHNYQPLPVTIASAEGAWVTDTAAAATSIALLVTPR